MTEQEKNLRLSALAQLPNSELEEMIRADFSESTKLDEDMVESILSVLEDRRREEDPSHCLNIQASWEKLQARAASVEEMDEPQVPLQTVPLPRRVKKRGKRLARSVAILAACLAFLLIGMVTAQAMGVNVFGLFAKWSNDFFQFAAFDRTERSVEEKDKLIQETTSSVELPIDLSDVWLPEDFSLSDERTIERGGMHGIHVEYQHPERRKGITIEVIKYSSIEATCGWVYMKDAGDPIRYWSNGRMYYLFTNCGRWYAVSDNPTLQVSIRNAGSMEEIKKIIDSIGELVYE